VAVIGTLLSLLVFFALFGIFLTQYVPLWMTDNESQFTSQAVTSFADFKQGVDSQYTLGGPPSIGTAFTISSQGVPLLAQPTEGTLAFLPTTCPNGFYVKGGTPAPPSSLYYGQPTTPGYCVFENVTLNYGPGASGATGPPTNYYTHAVPTGVLEMALPNRYYSPQTLYFEDDALIQSQGGLQQIVVLPPPLNVTTFGTNTTVISSFLQLYGNASTVIAQGSEQVYSHLRFTQVVSSNGIPPTSGVRGLTFTFEIGTQFPCAWGTYLWALMNGTGISQYTGALPVPTTLTSTFYSFTNPSSGAAAVQTIPVASTSCFGGTGGTTPLALTIGNINYATVFYAGAQVAVGVGGT
jgi:hypothetical protein